MSGVPKECTTCTEELTTERRRAQLQCGRSQMCCECAQRRMCHGSTKKRKTAAGTRG